MLTNDQIQRYLSDKMLILNHLTLWFFFKQLGTCTQITYDLDTILNIDT